MSDETKPRAIEILHRALAEANGSATREPLDDGTLLHVPGRSGVAVQYQGREAIIGLPRRMADLTEGTLRFTPSGALTADDQMIVVWGHSSASRQAKRLDTDTAYVALLRNDRVREVWIVHQDQTQFNNFWT
jgi:hypothetical protein